MKSSGKYKYLVFWVANYCNLSCDYCYAKKNFDNTVMDWETAKKALEVLDENGTLVLAGGEPLLNFSLIEKIYNYLTERKFLGKISIQTNGTLIDEILGEKLSKMNIKIGVSLDGVHEINDFFRGKTKDVIKGIKILEKYNKTISINCVLTDKNIDSLESLVERLYMFKNINALGLDLLRVIENGESKLPNIEKIYTNLKKSYEKSLFLGEILGKYIGIREIEDAKLRIENNHHSCNYCYSSIGETAVIIPSGEIYPCSSLVKKDEYYMGNINKGLIRKIFLPSGKYDFCGKCVHVKYCRGGCPSRVLLNERVNLEESDCNLRKAVFKIINS